MQFNRDTYYDDKSYTEDEVNYHSDDNDDIEMKGKLYWRPVVENEMPFAKELKWILQEEGMLHRKLTVRDTSFLKGIRASRRDLEEDVDRLIMALEKFGFIELYLEEDEGDKSPR